MRNYKTILADPPWDYVRDGKRHAGRSPRSLPSDEYPCMTVAELSELKVEELADTNAHLYLWVTNAFLEEGHVLARNWGFKPKTMITWHKDKMGVGWYFRGQTEHMLFCIRGSLKTMARDLSTVFAAERLKHSQKPKESYEFIEKASPGPRLELFARDRRDQWDVWGNEVESDIEL